MGHEEFSPVSPTEAFQRLKEGNLRFSKDLRSIESIKDRNDRNKLANAVQRPFAIILSCSDSRAPAELIFDQGVGDLFVVRVAGNIIAPSLVGSVEFAASTFGTQLVVVMGHGKCGAVSATIDTIRKNSKVPSENIQDIIERIRPQIEFIAKQDAPADKVLEDCIHANVMSSVSQLKHGSAVLESLIKQNKLAVVGAEYNLSTGMVEFFLDSHSEKILDQTRPALRETPSDLKSLFMPS